jgi:hypothetical protein
VTGGSATNGTDFNLAAGTLTFSGGQTTATIPVPTLTDNLLEGDETVGVTLSNPSIGASVGSPASTTLTIRDGTKPAQVRFGNDLVICMPTCRAFTARLRAEEGYTWLASSGTFSAYQSVRHPTLSNFMGDAVGIPGTDLFFPGSFTVMPNRRYALIVTLDGSDNIVLLQFDEGLASVTSAPLAPAAVGRLGPISSPAAPGAPSFQLAPRSGAPAAAR